MQIQDTSFLSLLLFMAVMPIVAKGLAEVYIKAASLLRRLKHKGDQSPVVF
jgi:hypothetical protein